MFAQLSFITSLRQFCEVHCWSTQIQRMSQEFTCQFLLEIENFSVQSSPIRSTVIAADLGTLGVTLWCLEVGYIYSNNVLMNKFTLTK